MQGYTRVTKLNSIKGRANYMTDPGRQEEVVLQSAPVDWKPYIDYERTHQKSKEKNNQGREIIFSIPNEWYTLPKPELREKVDHLCELAVGKSTDMQWAVHWNHDRTNLHVHVIFSERTRVPEHERKVYDRDIYLTDDGKVARRKADRARDENGNIKPPVHRKGEKQGEFSAKDTMYLQKTFNKQVRTKLEKEMTDKYGVFFDEKKPLKQFHHGKGSESEAIKKKNEIINEANQLLSILNEIGYDKPYNSIIRQFKEAIKEKRIPVVYWNSEKNQIGSKFFSSINQAYAFFQSVKGPTRDVFERTKTYVLAQKEAKQQVEPAPKPEPQPVVNPRLIEIEQEINRLLKERPKCRWVSEKYEIDKKIKELTAERERINPTQPERQQPIKSKSIGRDRE